MKCTIGPKDGVDCADPNGAIGPSNDLEWRDVRVVGPI